MLCCLLGAPDVVCSGDKSVLNACFAAYLVVCLENMSVTDVGQGKHMLCSLLGGVLGGRERFGCGPAEAHALLPVGWCAWGAGALGMHA